jgi:aldehyde dehydrogenase (NAD+)
MRIAQEEIFGPVLCVIPYDDDADAVRLANDSRYGLAGSVFTSDTERGLVVARSVRTGTFGINGYAPDPLAPFGGFKESGIGREWGEYGLDEYVEIKAINGIPPSHSAHRSVGRSGEIGPTVNVDVGPGHVGIAG